MKFGGVDNPETIDFTLPEDHPGTGQVLAANTDKGLKEIYIGCTTWSKAELKGFYPKGIKDPLVYYSRQLNAIEFNAPYYRSYGTDQVRKWVDKVPDGFKFFPKVHQIISHIKRLNNVGLEVDECCSNNRAFGEHLGMCFLQLGDNFGINNRNRLEPFFQLWHPDIPLAIEFRNTNWYNDQAEADYLYELMEQYQVTSIITDTAGRRDLLHMRLTTPTVFIRYVGTNHPSDYTRLEDWVYRIKSWQQLGLSKLYFFVHQFEERESPSLCAYFINLLNAKLGTTLAKPQIGASGQQTLLL